MSFIAIAHSKQIALWGADVGLGKTLFLVLLADDKAGVEAALAARPCGADDWTIVRHQDGVELDEVAILGRLSLREKNVEPALYPRLRGCAGLFKVKITNVENHLLVKKALEGLDPGEIKVKNPDIAAYLLHNALK